MVHAQTVVQGQPAPCLPGVLRVEIKSFLLHVGEEVIAALVKISDVAQQEVCPVISGDSSVRLGRDAAVIVSRSQSVKKANLRKEPGAEQVSALQLGYAFVERQGVLGLYNGRNFTAPQIQLAEIPVESHVGDDVARIREEISIRIAQLRSRDCAQIRNVLEDCKPRICH